MAKTITTLPGGRVQVRDAQGNCWTFNSAAELAKQRRELTAQELQSAPAALVAELDAITAAKLEPVELEPLAGELEAT